MAILIGAATTMLLSTSCNKKSEEVEPYLTPENVAVTSFKVSNNDVLANMDTVFFSIDLENGVIFNADSLPVGTDVRKLVATIKYSSYATKATIKMEGGSHKTGEINYADNQTDSIDFSGKVTLSLATATESVKKDYLIKVNVHKQKTDSLIWADLNSTKLPSRMDNPRLQRTIDFKGEAYSLIEENDGSYTFAHSKNLYDQVWTKAEATFPFIPDVRSFSANSASLAILDKDGNLYTSTDSKNWIATNQVWHSIIGGYTDTTLGICKDGSTYKYAQYPTKNLESSVIDSDFPIGNGSNFVTLVNKWTNSPIGFFVGGIKSNNTLSDITWAFDGRVWVKLTEGGIPPLKGAAIIPYYNYRSTSGTLEQTEYPVWMILGGQKADNSLNRTVYISYDNGVTWRKGDNQMQLPAEMPSLAGCDNVVMTTRMSYNLQNNWKRAPKRRVTTEVENMTLYWDCPYIYIIGGYNAAGELSNTIWRGALARLTFPPII